MRSDRDLVDILLGKGDEAAFRELYHRHTPRLYQFVLRLLGGSEADAEDVVQETWIRASRKLASFRWESALSTWLTAIALNLGRQQLRKNGRFTALEEFPSLEMGSQPSQDGKWIDLERAIAILPDGYRAVLVLHDIEGFKHEEISDQLGIAVGTSKSQLSRARQAMRALLGSRTGEEHVSR